MAWLKRVRDGRGDVGLRVEALKWNKEKQNYKTVGCEPMLDCCLLVGSVFPRTYSYDYWLTTEITEILETKDNYVRFKTKNSEYEFWK